MNNKVIAAVVIVIVVGVGILLTLDDPSPNLANVNKADDEEAPATRTRPGEPTRPDAPNAPEAKSPDPVIDHKPAADFKAPTETFRIICTGKVVSDLSGPVSGAQVSFSGTGVYRELQGNAYTDDYGQYTLLAWQRFPRGTLKGGNARIIITTVEGAHGLSNQIEESAETELAFEDIIIPAGRTLEGRVTDSNGNPMHNVVVRARSTEFLDLVKVNIRKPEVQRQQVQEYAFTDHGGHFRFSHLPSARYRVSVEATFAGRKDNEEAIDLRETPSHWLELELQPFQGLRGVVVDSAGDPLPGISINLVQPNSIDGLKTGRDFRKAGDAEETGPRSLRQVSRRRSVTDELGRFYFGGLVKGKYGVGAKSGNVKAELEDLEPSDTEHSITLGVTDRFSARVIDAETGKPVEIFDVRLLSSSNNTASGPNPFHQVNPNNIFGYHAAGQFSMANPHGQNARLQVTSPGYAVGFGASGDDSVIKLAPLCNLTFELKTGEKKRLALEPLVFLFENRIAFQATSDKFGQVSIPNIVPANYTVRVYLADGRELRGQLNVPASASATLTLNVEG